MGSAFTARPCTTPLLFLVFVPHTATTPPLFSQKFLTSAFVLNVHVQSLLKAWHAQTGRALLPLHQQIKSHILSLPSPRRDNLAVLLSCPWVLTQQVHASEPLIALFTLPDYYDPVGPLFGALRTSILINGQTVSQWPRSRDGALTVCRQRGAAGAAWT